VGGMDHIPMAFAAKLGGNIIQKSCEVKRIRRSGKGVEIYYLDKADGTSKTLKADYCICTIALPVLDTIPNDFSPKIKAAIKRNVVYGDGYKIAFQAPRFWETEAQIYGGLSFTDRDTFITWYPSYGFHKEQGIIVAGYAFTGGMGARSLPDQIEYARGTIERLHPGQSQKMKAPISVDWNKQAYNKGLAALIDEKDRDGQATLMAGDGPFYFAGDHLSHVTAWQQGAFASSHYVIDMIAKHQAAKAA
jgi:monoamine oxidase